MLLGQHLQFFLKKVKFYPSIEVHDSNIGLLYIEIHILCAVIKLVIQIDIYIMYQESGGDRKFISMDHISHSWMHSSKVAKLIS